MKISTCRTAIIFVLILQNSLLQAKTIYRWVDRNGKQHFSDRVSESMEVIEFEGKTLSSINMVKPKPLKSIKPSNRKSLKRKKKLSSAKPNRCGRLKRKIESVEKKLKQHLRAEKSDQFSRELSDLRWQKIKSC